MDNEDISIAKVWPSYRKAFFLEPCEINLEIKNKTARPIQIKKIECLFEVDYKEEDVYIPFITPFLTIDPGYTSRPIRIELKVDLAFRESSNVFSVVVHYRDNIEKTFKFDRIDYMIFNHIHHDDKIFFISHKDPEDRDTCRYLANFLRKLGFIGYLSEDNHSPGLGLWDKKIPNAIRSCAGVIVMWTSNASKSPDNIYREIKIAKTLKKPLIMGREKGITLPDVIPQDKEYYSFGIPISLSDLKKLACSIDDTYRKGGYS